MSIHKIGSDVTRPPAVRSVRGISPEERGAKGHDGSGDLRSGRADEVHISAEGRELAAKVLDTDAPLSGARLEEIRARIQEGHYEKPSVAEDVARRILSAGDV